MSHYHHPHHHTPKKSIPSDFPPSNLQDKVITLAKINMVVTVIPVVCLLFFMLLVYFRIDLITEYARSNNSTFIGGTLNNFVSLERNKQWSTLLVQCLWSTVEVILAFTLLTGAKTRAYGYMKAWLLLMTASFLAEVGMQGILFTSSDSLISLPILLIVTFVVTDIYRFCCLFIVYLLIDEMLERGEVKRGVETESNMEFE